MRVLLFFLHLVIGWRLPGQAVQAPLVPISPIGVLRTEADRYMGTRVRVEGIALREYVKGFPLFFVEDATGGIYIDAPPSGVEFHHGDRVQVTGLVVKGGLASDLKAESLTVVKRGVGAVARLVPLAHISDAKEDCRLVRVRGKVTAFDPDFLRSTEFTDPRLIFWLTSGETSVIVNMPYAATLIDPLIGAEVEAEGMATGLFSPDGRWNMARVRLRSVADLRITSRTDFDQLLRLPLTKVNAILRFRGTGIARDPVHVRGVVTAYNRGVAVFIRGDGAGLMIRTPQVLDLHPGDEIDAAGFPKAPSIYPQMDGAFVKKLASGPAPPARRVEWSKLWQGWNNMDLVEVEATLLDYARLPQFGRLTVEAEGRTLTAELVDGPAQLPMEKYSRLRLTGVSWLDAESNLLRREVNLILRSKQDIQLLGGPPLLMSSSVRQAAAGALGFFCFFLFYVVVLRRRIKRQGVTISDSLTKESNMEARYRDLVEHASDAIFSHDPQRRIVSWNRAAETYTGYGRAETLGRVLTEIIASEDHGALDAYELQLRTHGVARTEYAFVSAHGERRRFEVSAQLVQSGAQKGLVECIGRDVTERRRTEQELEKAKHAAELANAAKSRFLANISHEIRTPLNGVIGLTKLLAGSPLSGAQKEWAELAHLSTETLLRLLNDVLDLSKIEAGKMVVERTPFHLKMELDHLAAFLQPEAQRKSLELAVCWDSDIPPLLMGDPVRLRQILLNLCGNAMKFTSQGSIRIEAKCIERSPGGTRCEIAVQDTGIGISAEQLPLIFQPFRQADESTSRRFGGTGLGLSISRQLVELMGGEMGAESLHGDGSRFWFRLTFENAAGGAETVVAAQEPLQLPAMHVLVAEDNVVNQRLIQAFLEKLRVDHDMASDGNQAWAMFLNGRYDLVLTDIQMPECDGLELTRRIREQAPAERNGVPILAVTAHAMAEDQQKCLAAGMNDYITKPIELDQLAKKLYRWSGAGGAIPVA